MRQKPSLATRLKRDIRLRPKPKSVRDGRRDRIFWLLRRYCAQKDSGVSIVGAIPTMDTMRLFQAADVLAMTNLSRHQLREWTGRGRRALLTPDVEAEGPGRHALYSWQTILVLRLLHVLHRDFAAEVGAWAPALQTLRAKLDRVSFPALWDLGVFFPNREEAELTSLPMQPGASGIFISLEPHLSSLSIQLASPRPRQLSLFPAVAVGQ